MAITQTDIGLSLDLRMFGEVLLTNGVDIERKQIQLGKNGIPSFSYGVGSDTVGGFNIGFIASGVLNIPANSLGVIDFTVEEDLAGVIIGGARIKYALLSLKSPAPDDLLRSFGPRVNSDVSACALGLSPSTAAVQRYRHYIYIDPVIGSTGSKIPVFNYTLAEAVDIAWVLAGVRA